MGPRRPSHRSDRNARGSGTPAGSGWRALDVLAIDAWHGGTRDAERVAAERLVAEQRFPAAERERIERNRAWYA